MFALLRTKRIQLHNHADANSEAFPTLKGLCVIYIYIYIYRIEFRMLEVRKNEIALRKLSAGTARLRTLEGALHLATLCEAANCMQGSHKCNSKNP